MIIELSSGFAALDENGWLKYRSPIENLLSAHRQGWHIFSPNREVCHSLINSNMLSDISHGILKHHISNKMSTMSGQARSSKMTMVCTPDDDNLDADYANQICAPLLEFDDLECCGRTRLITENASRDGALLEILCQLLARILGFSLKLSLEHVHGGGSTTGDRYEDACGKLRPTLCIVDSDEKYPDCARGQTAARVNALKGTEVYASVQNFILPVRELENTIPISLLYEVYQGNPEQCDRVQRLCRYIDYRNSGQQLVPGNALNFFDIKAGLIRSDIFAFPQDAKGLFHCFDKSITNITCEIVDYDEENGQIVVHEGVSENVMAQFLAYLNNHQYDRNRLIQKYIKSPDWHWLSELLRTITSFAAGGQRLPIPD